LRHYNVGWFLERQTYDEQLSPLFNDDTALVSNLARVWLFTSGEAAPSKHGYYKTEAEG
jgi:hypothetical protein